MQAARRLTPEEIGLTRRAAERFRTVGPTVLERNERRQLFKLFPDETHGTFFARHLYAKHMEFFGATKTNREVAMMAANRVGKSTGAGYAGACFATGWYPEWWPGRVFNSRFPTVGWACGKTNEKLKEIVQDKLFGQVIGSGSNKTVTGTGLIPGEWIGRLTWRQGIPDVIETAKIKHLPTGKWSTIVQKSYEQGRDAYEGTNIKWIWLDEEPPKDIYEECVTRTTATTGNYDDNGVVIASFTPLDGISHVVKGFMPGGMND